jgi:predicted Zn-dependent peptidase
LGFPLAGFKKLKDKRFVYSILSMILGEKSSSRLWLKIREEMGAAYYVRSNFVDYSDRSLFFIQAGITIDRLGEVLSEIVKEINLLKKEGPDIKELEISKAVLKSNLLMDIEESLGIAIFYGRHFLTEKKILTPKEIEKKINSIKIEDLKEELKKIFLYPQLKFAAILPHKINFNFSKIFKQMLK